MKINFLFFTPLVTSLAKLLGPGGTKALLAENLLIMQQLLLLTRTRQRAPTLSFTHRLLLGFCFLFLTLRRRAKSAVFIKTLFAE